MTTELRILTKADLIVTGDTIRVEPRGGESFVPRGGSLGLRNKRNKRKAR